MDEPISHSILVVDDEATLGRNIKRYLARQGYDTHLVETGEDALEALDTFRPDLILLDYHLPGMNGLEVLGRIRKTDTQVKIIIMTGAGGVQVAVDAMKAGANDYLSKPLVLAELKLLLDKVVGQVRAEGALAYYQNKQARQSGLATLLGKSAPILELKEQIQHYLEAERRLAYGDPPPVLITGETGTGKGLVARAFHFDGPRGDKPMVELNCASIPSQLLEAELFGYERGAFTDAKERKLGLVESANGGTLFLDEIGDMDLSMQAKLLTVLETKRIRRVGGLRDRNVDVRIIAATNQDLDERVQSGQFRLDLLFRIRVIHIELPPLRERSDDVEPLVDEFLKLQSKRYGKPKLHLSAEAVHTLQHYHWPGNIRELRNVIERAVLLTTTETVESKHLALISDAPQSNQGNGLGPIQYFPDQGLNLERVEAELVKLALERAKGNVTRAAKLLGISRDTLRYRIEKYG